MLPDVLQIVVDGRVHGEASGLPNGRCSGRDQESGLEGIELDRLRAGGLKQILELGDRAPPTPSPFIPLQVIATFGMVLVTARDPDVIPNDPAVVFDNGGERPLRP